MTWLDAEGWWEQAGWGRQSMDPLQMRFADGRIEGTGVDIVGRFLLNGWLRNGQVHLRKQYLGLHSLDYVGHYDGEGVLDGEWRCAGTTGESGEFG